MDKNLKREMKKARKQIYIFLLIMFPCVLLLSFLLYYFIPALQDYQVLVIIIMVALSGIAFVIYEVIDAKRQLKKSKEPKKFDPYAD